MRTERGKGGVSGPRRMARAHWIKALEELPRVVGSPWIVTVTSSTSPCLSVPECPYPSPRGTVWMRPRAQHKGPAQPWCSAPVSMRGCTDPRAVGSHQCVRPHLQNQQQPRLHAPGYCLCHRDRGRTICPGARGNFGCALDQGLGTECRSQGAGEGMVPLASSAAPGWGG